ncbi:hypothetical protein [Ensifer sp. ZNC0028]|uniref:hypothetical protein n=1 Tax=Ensifer sp. ZNC0028 TaxID=1339236 RepID=UPI0005B7ECCE|nr:hypothetical protein [Ensifer sp. ZNC0028]
MKKWLRVLVYTVVTLFGLFVVLVGLVLATIDPYASEDMSRGGICERSGNVAKECAMPPESAEKVLAALLTCDTQFFKTLDEEKAVFKRSDIVARPYNLLDTSDPRTSVVPFSEPVEAYGLHITGYAQQVLPGTSEYAWAFYASEQPDDVMRALETVSKGATGATAKSNAFEVAASDMPDFPGARLGCRVAGAQASDIEDFPSIYDLFLSNGLSTALFNKFDLFVASVIKTFSDFGR